jgi:hypothetical protein
MSVDPDTLSTKTALGLDKLADLLSAERSVASIEAQRQRDQILSLTNDMRSSDNAIKVLSNDSSNLDVERQRQRDLISQLTNDQRTSSADLSVLKTRLDSLTKDLTESRRTNWPTIISLSLLLPTLSAIAIYVISSEIGKATTPIGQSLSTMTIQEASNTQAIGKLTDSSIVSTVADVTSRSDRLQLNDRLRSLETQFVSDSALRRGSITEIGSRLAETEQQFHAISNIDNLRWAHQLRDNAMLYEKINPGQRYPTDSFFPTSIFQSSPQPLSQP